MFLKSPNRHIIFSFLIIFNRAYFITDKAKKAHHAAITNKIVSTSDKDWPNCIICLHFCRPNSPTFCTNLKLTEPDDLLYLCNLSAVPLQPEKQAAPLLFLIHQPICKLQTSPSTQHLPVRKVHTHAHSHTQKANTQTATFPSHEIKCRKAL